MTFDIHDYNVHDNEFINELPSSHVFVFGSNLAGRHGAGAALHAHRKFNACYHVGEGLTGQSYALPTLDRNLRKMPETLLFHYFYNFIMFAIEHEWQTFVMTKVGCGLAGYDEPELMYNRFIHDVETLVNIPKNIIFPIDFIKV